MAESEFYEWLAEVVLTNDSVRLGIGDDAAVLNFATADDVVVTSDLLAEGVHFDAEVDLRRVGHKALAVNLSDLAAMGARPVAAIVALLLNQETALRSAKSIIEGMQPLARRHDLAIVGGDTNSWCGQLVITVTAIGCMDGRLAMRRDGAHVGDVILVTGTLGGSLANKHLDFEPRVNEAIALASHYDIHAMMDISDGLALDLSRMAESSGCGACLELAQIPISSDARAQAEEDEGKSALDRALSDGEDFELLVAAAPNVAAALLKESPLAVPLTRVGEFVAGSGLWSIDQDLQRQALPIRGYEHDL